VGCGERDSRSGGGDIKGPAGLVGRNGASPIREERIERGEWRIENGECRIEK